MENILTINFMRISYIQLTDRGLGTRGRARLTPPGDAPRHPPPRHPRRRQTGHVVAVLHACPREHSSPRCGCGARLRRALSRAHASRALAATPSRRIFADRAPRDLVPPRSEPWEKGTAPRDCPLGGRIARRSGRRDTVRREELVREGRGAGAPLGVGARGSGSRGVGRR